MFKVDTTTNTLVRLERPTMQETGMRERDDLQSLIRNSCDEFFAEIDEKLLLLGEEVRPSADVDNRIDLLAVDHNGVVVIIELKRGVDRYQLFQALGYAAMIADWDADELAGQRARLKGISLDEARKEIDEFVRSDEQSINVAQRVVLIAERFPYEVLVTTEWLVEAYGLNVRCISTTLAVTGDTKLLACAPIYPIGDPKQAAARRRPRVDGSSFTSWEEAMADTENDAMRRFYLEETEADDVANSLVSRSLTYTVAGEKRYKAYVRGRHAYLRQLGRFSDDTAFWRARLSRPDGVGTTNGGQDLSMSLESEGDFKAFRSALEDLASKRWGGAELADSAIDLPEDSAPISDQQA